MAKVKPSKSAPNKTLSVPAGLPPQTIPQTSPVKASTLWLFLLPVAVGLAFSFGFANGFVDWDDAEYVFNNPLVLKPTSENLGHLLKAVVALNYHPLTMLSLWLNAHFFGSAAASFIVTNTLLHVLNTLLVFYLARNLSHSAWTGGFVALIWGLHPMHVESVIWVSERKDVLYTFFFLGACLVYLRYLRTKSPAWLLLTFGLFACSCFSKAMAVVLPLVLFLLDYWNERRLSRRIFVEKVPFFLLALWVGLMATNVQAGGDFRGWLTILTPKKDAIGQEPFAFRWLVYGSYGFVLYLIKLFIPYGLAAYHPYPNTTQIASGHYWLGPIFFLVTVGATIWCLWSPKTQRQRLFGFGMGFFIITIALVLQFMTVGAALMADRYSYLSYFGLIFLLVHGIYEPIRAHSGQKQLATIGLSLFAVMCFWITTQQVQVWKSTETLWLNALKQYPTDDQMREGLGDYYGKNNRIDEATQQFELAVKDGTVRYHCYEGLGNAYGLKGDFQRSIAMYNEALRIDSTKEDVYYNRGLTFNKMGRHTEAVRDLNKVLALVPTKDTMVFPARGFAYLQMKDYPKSLNDYELYLRQFPNDATALHNRGVNRFYLGNRAGALADLRRAVALKPDYEEAKNNLKTLEQAAQ